MLNSENVFEMIRFRETVMRAKGATIRRYPVCPGNIPNIAYSPFNNVIKIEGDIDTLSTESVEALISHAVAKSKLRAGLFFRAGAVLLSGCALFAAGIYSGIYSYMNGFSIMHALLISCSLIAALGTDLMIKKVFRSCTTSIKADISAAKSLGEDTYKQGLLKYFTTIGGPRTDEESVRLQNFLSHQ